jgi:hypothetical protein
MALADLLVSNGDVAAAKGTLLSLLTTLVITADNYAKAALGAANAVLDVAEEHGPCAAAYTNYAEIGRYTELTVMVLNNIDDLTELVLAVHETGDPYADDAYAEHIEGMSRLGEIDAIMEAVQTRLGMINSALPENPAPGAIMALPVRGAESDVEDDYDDDDQ